MRENKDGFFARMKNSEKRGFEVTMFSISVLIGVALLISIIWFAITWSNASSNNITDEEANASSVTESAITETEEEAPTATPYGNAIINENNMEDGNSEDIDEDLTKSEYGYTSTSVNLRSSASLTATVLAKVPMNTKVKLVKLHDKEWMEVIYNGTTGYINARYLTTTKTVVATYSPTTAPTRTAVPATAKPKKTAKPTAKPTKKPTKTKKPPIAITPAPTAKATAEPSKPTEAPTEKPTTAPAPTEEPKPTTAPTNAK